MKEQSAINKVFTPDMIETIASIWTSSTISLIDVRLKNICEKHPLDRYQMPSSMLVFACGGTAQIRLNRNYFEMERFCLLHGGKGTEMSITSDEAFVQVFMVYYKAEAPPFYKKELQQRLKQVNPFIQQFGYAPHNPLLLKDYFQQMLNYWNYGKSLGYLQAKSMFYQLISGMYRDLERSEIRFLQPDPAVVVKQYLDENYRQPIMFQEIAETFGISGGQLTRLFKKKEGLSLQDYLIQKRLKVASNYLQTSEATIKEIATMCGFVDEKNLSRMFKKYYKLTPSDYRKINAHSPQVDGNNHDYYPLYNEKRLDNVVIFQKDGELAMFGQIRSKELILAAALSLILLLSACGAAPTNNSSSVTAATATATASSAQITKEAKMRIVQAANGEVAIPNDPQRLVISGFAYGDIIPFELTNMSLVLEGWADLKNKSETWLEYWEHATTNTTLFESFDDLEGIMQLEPDIIVGTTGQISYETGSELQKIATTILYDQENIDSVHYTMKDRITFLGELFAMPEKAQQLIELFDHKVMVATAALADEGLADKKVVFVHGLENGHAIIATDINQSLTYKILGLAAPTKVEQEMFYHDTIPDDLHSAHVKIVSLEELPAYLDDADIIIYRHFDDSEASIIAKLSQIDVWTNIPAVKSGNVRYVAFNEPLFGFSYADYSVALDIFVDMLKQLPIAQHKLAR